jgi:rhodanese-related sulfurtransferase
MKKNQFGVVILLLLLISGAILIGSCTEQAEAPTQLIKDITTQEAFNLIQDNQGNSDFIIIDVRTPEEFEDGHIKNAVNIDFRSENFRSQISDMDRLKKYLIYCRSGNRSRGALDIMTELGFKEVYHLTVGIIGWLEDGLPIAK